jgi:DNA-binding transcriptional regulator/RsmH inhibitor MraZ
MTTFYGTDTYSIDAKGRLAIPATARRARGEEHETFFLVPGFEGVCLCTRKRSGPASKNGSRSSRANAASERSSGRC